MVSIILMKRSSKINKCRALVVRVSSTFVYDRIMFWHLRLGHYSFSYLKHLFLRLFRGVDCNLLHCEACVLSKNH